MGKQVDQVPTEAYEAPMVRVLGSVEELTKAQNVGALDDANFGSDTLPHHSI